MKYDCKKVYNTGVNRVQLFSSSLPLRQNKLECFAPSSSGLSVIGEQGQELAL